MWKIPLMGKAFLISELRDYILRWVDPHNTEWSVTFLHLWNSGISWAQDSDTTLSVNCSSLRDCLMDSFALYFCVCYICDYFTNRFITVYTFITDAQVCKFMVWFSYPYILTLDLKKEMDPITQIWYLACFYIYFIDFFFYGSLVALFG